LQDLNFHELHEKIYYKSLYYYFINEIKKKDKISNSLKKIFNIGENISETIYLDSLKKQEILQNEFNKILIPYDAVVTFSTSSSAVGRNETPMKDNSLIWTLAHLPAINSHLNFCPNNMPFGIQFTGKKWNDYVILDFLDYLIDQNYLDAKCAKINKS
jgi:Asp-tRNA(Asn)/Glu-tRNA(Gln) amidotransferase A subunit family amidase